VIGNPHWSGNGFQMLMKADAGGKMVLDCRYAKELGYFNDMTEWYRIYDYCDYKIPENASPDISTQSYLLDDEVTIEVPAGPYDFIFVIPQVDYVQDANLALNGVNDWEGSLRRDFMFKAGYEYIFETSEYGDILFNSPDNVGIKQLLLPPISANLTDKEDVKIIIKNEGTEPIESAVGITYRINHGEWIEPEMLELSLAPNAEKNYTFKTKANLSSSGLQTIDAYIIYQTDIYGANDYITGYTKNQKNQTPLSLPFILDFSEEWHLPAYWTVYDANGDGSTWKWNIAGVGADGRFGACASFSPKLVSANDFLVTDPISIPEAGTYSISFDLMIWQDVQKLKILYGTSPDVDEMEVLVDFPELDFWDFGDDYSKMAHNFEIETGGTYYFAFHHYSLYQFFPQVRMDNIMILEGEYTGLPDIMTKRCMPISSCFLSSEERVGVEVINSGSEKISQFTLTYQVNDGEIVSQIFNETIGIKQRINVYFDETFDFSEVGAYNIKFTAETPNEENTADNESVLVLRNYAPITELPFETNFAKEGDRNDWIELEGDWGFDGASTSSSYYALNYTEGPLLSRCIHLNPGTYSFSFAIFAGWGTKESFYVAYGKSGTDPYEWESAKDYSNFSTHPKYREYESFIFEITEADDYVFAFFPVQIINYIDLFEIAIDSAPEHDFAFKNVESEFFTRLTPRYHFGEERTFTTTLQNKGATANENGNISVTIKDEEVTFKNFAFTALNETLHIDLETPFNTDSEREFALKFKASLPSGKTKEFEVYKALSDSTFAYDNIDGGFANGLGISYSSGSLGMIYELKKADILTSVNIGFFNYPDAANEEFIIAVYEMNDDNTVGNKFSEIQHLRTIGNNAHGMTFDFPDTELPAGKYFIEIRQLSNVLLGIAFDSDYNGYYYRYYPDTGQLTKNRSYGYIHVRPNFGKSKYSINASANPLEGGTIEGQGQYGYDESITLTATANEDYSFINWTENGIEVSSDTQYTFEVKANRDLTANFVEIIYHTITAMADANGSITPSGAVRIPENSDMTYTITPNTDYAIAQVFIDGVNNPSAVATGSYTFSNITSDHSIVVVFGPKVGISELANAELSVYPNPFKDEINISGPLVVKRVKIMDISGQIVKDVLPKGNAIPTSELAIGTYLVSLEMADGETVVRKLIKK